MVRWHVVRIVRRPSRQLAASERVADYLRLGFDFHDYDKRQSATWKFLRGATAEQVTAQVTRIFEADNRLVSGTILRRLLDPAVA